MYSLGGNTRKEIVGQSNCMCKTMRELKKKSIVYLGSSEYFDITPA